MSKETEPIRSRRQLREQSAPPAGAQAVPAAPASSVPVSPVPAAPGPAAPPQDVGVSGGGIPAAPGQAPAASDAPAPRERQSQTRARDRAALRAYKELIDPPGLSPLPSRKALRQAQIDADRAPVTAVNPVVSVAAKPSGSPQTQQAPAVAQGAGRTAGHPADSADDSAAAPAAETVQETAATPRPQAVPAAATVPALRTRAGRRAAPATGSSIPGFAQPATQRPPSAPPENGVPEAATPEAAAPAPAGAGNPQAESLGADTVVANPAHPEADAEASLLQGARPAAAKVPSPPAAKPGSGAVPTAAPAAADLETGDIPETAGRDAASANDMDGNVPPMPGLVPGGDYYPISAGPPVAPSTEELKVLAAKRAETERAAILAERARARERLAQESAKNRRPASDPTATNNLAMVTPLEFIDVPGMDRPVLRPPATTHVPIVTRSTPRQLPAAPGRPAAGGRADAAQGAAGADGTAAATNGEAAAHHGAPSHTVPNISAERFDAALAARAVHRPGPGNRPLTGGRSSTLKRAEEMAGVARPVPADGSGTPSGAGVQAGRAAAEAAPVQRSQMPPMPADYAHGLEPLDAMTAGLGRTQRNLLILWGSIILGGAALVACTIMVLGNIFN